MKTSTTLTALAVALALSACSSKKEEPVAAAPPPPPPPTSLDLTIRGTPDLNPSPSGRPSPVMVEVFQLASPTAFSQSDFFALSEQRTTVLGSEMVARKAFALAPASEERIEEMLPPSVTHIGVMAAYRDIQNANWRSIIAVPKNVVTTVTIEAGAAGLMTAATLAEQHEVTWSDRR